MLQPNLERQGVNIALDANLTYWDVNNRYVGINTSVPNYPLDVHGNVHIGNLYVTGINDSAGSFGTSGFILSTDGANVTWKDPTSVSVSPSYVQNTDSRTLSGNLYFTAANTFVSNLNVATINRSPTLTLGGDVSGTATFNKIGRAHV